LIGRPAARNAGRVRVAWNVVVGCGLVQGNPQVNLGNDPSPARSFDLLMLVANEEGRVRTEAEFRGLFAAAGLCLARVIPTATPNFILEGVPA
jgi:hypothetical protein